MFGLGLPEILIVLVFVLLFFGAERLPEIGRSIGKALNEFKRGMQDLSEDKKSDDKKSGDDAGKT